MYPVSRFLLGLVSLICYLALPISLLCFIAGMGMATGTYERDKPTGMLIAPIAAGAFIGSIVILVQCDIARAMLHTARNTDLLVELLKKHNSNGKKD